MFLCPSGVFDVQVVHKIVKTMSDNGQFVYKKMDFCFMIYLLGVNWRQKKKLFSLFSCLCACVYIGIVMNGLRFLHDLRCFAGELANFFLFSFNVDWMVDC